MQSIQSFLPLLSSPRKIVILTHYRPDGDAIGSSLALYHYLKKKGHQVTAVVPNEIPPFLLWMPGVRSMLNFEQKPGEVRQAMSAADIIFGLDFNAFHRANTAGAAMEESKATKVMIDHHLFPSEGWDYGISLPEKSSTCEMVYDFIRMNGDGALIDKDIATCIYTGTMTDTGSFRFPATTASVHLMIADLLTRGMKHTEIHEAVNDSWTPNRMRFLGYVLTEKMELLPQWKTGLIAISKKDMQLFHLGPGDTEGLVNYPLSISDIRFSVLVTEKNEDIRLSFRSKGDFDVNSFARTYFNGGGHFNASGGRSLKSFSETIAHFKEILSDIHPR